MEIDYGIDWLSITAKNRGELPPVLPYLADEHYTETKAKNGYTVARKFTLIGAIEMSNPARPDMGVHTIYSGSALRNLWQYGKITPYDVLRWHMAKRHNVSRIDVRIDVHNGGLDIPALYEQKKLGLIETQAKSVSMIETQGSSGYAGSTLYIGSMAKRKKLLRVYDKAAQLGTLIDGVLADHKRIEFEVHGAPATNLSKEITDLEWMSSKVIASAIKGYANFPKNETWGKIFADVDAWKVGSMSAAEKTGDTRQWLLDQCAPALARQIAADPAFMSIFWEKVTFELEKNGEINHAND